MNTRAVLALLAGVVATLFGCSSSYEGATAQFTLPPETGFDSVTTPLVFFCGSIDCHGGVGRNLRLYGMQGRRLDPTDVPCGAMTKQAEIDADYQSFVGLEPEILAAVVKDGGKHPERLTVIRKARGTEKHTGGVVFAAGSDGDHCLTEWIAGQTDQAGADCNNAIPQNPRPLCVP
ncbi:MAG TPA: hypothetical protein VH062_00095 [Polyangiaceae bacterium]|jgi:hypothetical protein|nr:hypothetical protein [Polyangiaceae bacterium]